MSWHLDQKNPEVLARSPLAIKSKLPFTQKGDICDDASMAGLSKFGFLNVPNGGDDRPESSAAAASRLAPVTRQDVHGKEQSLDSREHSLPANLALG